MRKRTSAILSATAALLAALAMAAVPAHATYTSDRAGSTATLTDSGTTSSNVAVYQSGGLLAHSLTSTGFHSRFDWDTGTTGEQTLANDAASSISIVAGEGHDGASIGREPVGGATPIIGAWASEIVAQVTFAGQGGTDRLAVDNAGDSVPRTYTMDGDTLDGASTATFGWSTTEEFRLLAGASGDSIGVSGVLPKTTIYAGGGPDELSFSDGATLSGGIADGGSGDDELNYQSYTTAVQVDLGAEQAFVADPMNGANERPTPRTSNSTGTMIMKFDGATLVCDLDTAIRHFDRARMVGAHLHHGGVNDAGPVIVNLDGNASGNLFTMFGDLTTRTKNVSMPVGEEDDLVAGGLYINIHSTTFTGGEIRGQVLPGGEAGPATGTAWQARFEDVTGGSAGDTITGGAGANELAGGAGDDTLNGDEGDDFLEPGLGRDTVDGGANPGGGVDTISYADRGGRVAVKLDGVRNDGADPNASGGSTSTEENDLDLRIENAVGGTSHDRLGGSNGVNTLTGGLGNDVLTPRLGRDTVSGGGDSDTLDYSDRTTSVAVRLDGLRNDGNDPNQSGTSTNTEEADQDISIEHARGGSAADRFVGSAGANTLTGNGGGDLFDGGLGPDLFDGGTGTDRISYAARGVPIAVTLDGVRNDGADGNSSGHSTVAEENDRDLSIEEAEGGAAPDRMSAIVANAVVNLLIGNGGDDRIKVRDGTDANDTANCGEGADTYDKDPSDTHTADCETAGTL